MRRVLGALLSGACQAVESRSPALPLREDFEHGLARWELSSAPGVELLRVDEAHGTVLRLQPNGDVYALLVGSESFGDVALEGELCFPTADDAYLGWIHDWRERGGRVDFGCVYLKSGKRAYLQPNPRRDGNVTRTFFPEFVAPLAGASAPRAGEWLRFRVELVGGACHVYVGDLAQPALTFPLVEGERGALGFEPRSVGAEVWVDNLTVTPLERFTWRGPLVPESARCEPDPLALGWEVLGPLARTRDEIARDPDAFSEPWRRLEPDFRGGIETGRVIDYHGERTVAYFRARIPSGPERTLRLSTVDDLAVWFDGRFVGFFGRDEAAWADQGHNPEHAGTEIALASSSAEAWLVVRVRGGTYASGGFFARLEPVEARK